MMLFKSRNLEVKVIHLSNLKGDATWHYGWTMHNAPGNKSTEITREAITIIFFAEGASVTEPQNKHQENDRQRWLGNLKPGSAAASALNPLVL